MIQLIEKYPYLSLFLCVFIILGFTIDAIPVSIMEARNFISAREMLTDNNWLLTTMNGEPRYQKPPLPTWITAVFGFLFGMKNLLALRWPALLMIAVTGITIYEFSKRLSLSKSHSLINGFIVISSFYVIGITIEGIWDIYTHGFMLIALFQLFKSLQKQEINFKNGVLFVLFLGASILSKGPVSLYVLLVSFLIAYGFSYSYTSKKRTHLLSLLGLLVLGLVLGASWFIYVRYADPETFTKIASKETGNWSSYNVRPFYYYWSFFTQSGLWTIPAFISLLYPYLKSRVTNIKAYKFSLFWTLIAVILLSVIPEKKSRYLMPVLIPLAINIGFYINYLIRTFQSLKDRKETFSVYFNFGLIGSIALLIPFSGFFISDYFEVFPIIRFIIFSIVLLMLSIFIFRSLFRKQIHHTFYFVIAFMISVGCFGLPLVKKLKANDYMPISELSNSEKKLFNLNYVAPEMIYNYGDKIPTLTSKAIKNDNNFYALCQKCSDTILKPYSKDFSIEFVKSIDLNKASKDSRSYNKRLANKLYLFTRK